MAKDVSRPTAVVIVMLIFGGCVCIGLNQKNDPSESVSGTTSGEHHGLDNRGKTGRIVNIDTDPNKRLVPICASKEALEKLRKVHRFNDTEGGVLLMLQGVVFAVPDGTRVRVLDYEQWFLYGGMYEVRVLEGDNYSRSGWLTEKAVSF